MSLDEKLKGQPLPRPAEWELRPQLLLHPQIPSPLHGLAPRVVLGEEWWDKTRQEAYKSTDYHCAACGLERYQDTEFPYLEAHEIYEIDYRRGRMIYLEAAPLCHYCHSFIHSGRLRMLLEEGKVSSKFAKRVLARGALVLKKAKLKKPLPYAGKCPPSYEWRLIVNGKEYPPLSPIDKGSDL